MSSATITHDLIVQMDAGADVSQTSIGHDLIAQSGADIGLSGVTIGHDLRAESGASLHLELATIRHDLVASQPQTVQTGRNGPDSPGGPVNVGHDFVITASPAAFDFVFDGICNATVAHDFRITDRAVTLGFGIGDQCAQSGEPANTIGHDLIVTGNSALVGVFGPSALEVGGNQVGHNLVFTGNTAAAGGYLEVSDNKVGHDAICFANNPAPSRDANGDGPNSAGHSNTCG